MQVYRDDFCLVHSERHVQYIVLRVSRVEVIVSRWVHIYLSCAFYLHICLFVCLPVIYLVCAEKCLNLHTDVGVCIILICLPIEDSFLAQDFGNHLSSPIGFDLV